MPQPHLHRPRWTHVVVSALLVSAPTVAFTWGVVLLVLDRPVGGSIGGLALVVGMSVLLGHSFRSRPMAVGPDGLVITRDGVRITLRWADFAEARTRSFGRVELWFTRGLVEPANGDGAWAVRQARRRGLHRAVRLHPYFADWRTSEVFALIPGERCRPHRAGYAPPVAAPLVYRPRWAYVLGLAVPATAVGVVIGWLVVYLIYVGAGAPFHQSASGLAAMTVGMAALFSYLLRSQPMTVAADGLSIDRNGVRITLRWADLAEVRTRSFGRAELWFTEALIEAGEGTRPRVVARLRKRGTARVVRLHAYFTDWRASEIAPLVAR
ncbi:hypothetical protein [Actinokineospora sp. NBRC 105648]|uniref:hypothetical protein n=1 Tax=Actinokineospora sp. NBRC 105648 TaxID=3032206 RepID=UPI0024A2F7F1|nr:hypothetical protein [Actinokineospora sp. NBRC 105648]GLZ41743.1 hypothetical protein Acsp05_53670 [Actinokineospora sp. NBRC 105648]